MFVQRLLWKFAEGSGRLFVVVGFLRLVAHSRPLSPRGTQESSWKPGALFGRKLASILNLVHWVWEEGRGEKNLMP